MNAETLAAVGLVFMSEGSDLTVFFVGAFFFVSAFFFAAFAFTAMIASFRSNAYCVAFAQSAGSFFAVQKNAPTAIALLRASEESAIRKPVTSPNSFANMSDNPPTQSGAKPSAMIFKMKKAKATAKARMLAGASV